MHDECVDKMIFRVATSCDWQYVFLCM